MFGPDDVDRRVDIIDESGHDLQGQSGTDYDRDGSQHEDNRCATEHENVTLGMEQGSLGAEEGAEEGGPRGDGS